MKDRNCKGDSAKKDRPVVLGVEFDKCPEAYLRENPEMVWINALYYACCGYSVEDEMGSPSKVIHMPFEGPVTQQPNIVHRAFSIIAGETRRVSALMSKERNG